MGVIEGGVIEGGGYIVRYADTRVGSMYKTLLTLYDQTVIAKVYQEATKSLVIDCSHMPVSCGLSGPWACKTVSPFLVQPVIVGPTMLSMCHGCAPSLNPPPPSKSSWQCWSSCRLGNLYSLSPIHWAEL